MNNSSQTKAWQQGQRTISMEYVAAQAQWDLIVVGGGITGAGIYREAARLGYKVLLVEQQDFAWGTSSRSSKMVHGGLRYLASGQFGLARDSVRERQRLMEELPGLVDPLAFMMGHYRGKFPGPWIFGKLLAIYDWMAGKHYRRKLKTALSEFWVPGIATSELEAISGFFDAVTDDARLVMRVLQAGNTNGGIALNYARAQSLLEQQGEVKGIVLEDLQSGQTLSLRAKHVVNATGAWSDQLRQQLGQHQVIRPLRGSHLVVPFWRLPVGGSVSFMHPEDKRPVFVFPWEGATVIGTTDLDHQDGLDHEAAISDDEVSYLLDAANGQFPEANVSRDDVIATWAGVRPVVSKHKDQSASDAAHKPSDEKREHAIWQDRGMISVAGGKLTTYRLIADEVLAKTGLNTQATRAVLSARTFSEAQQLEDPRLSVAQRKRLQGRYGVGIQASITLANDSELKRVGNTDTLWWELKWACENESVQHLDDLLLRRTRIGLLLPQGGSALHDVFKERCGAYLKWNAGQWDAEWQRYQRIIARYYGLPGAAQ